MGELQAAHKVLNVLWSEPSIKAVLEKRKLDQGKADLGDDLEAVFSELGMPRRLSEVGIAKDKLDGLAEGSLSDSYCKSNVIFLERKEQVMEILKMAVDWLKSDTQ